MTDELNTNEVVVARTLLKFRDLQSEILGNEDLPVSFVGHHDNPDWTPGFLLRDCSPVDAAKFPEDVDGVPIYWKPNVATQRVADLRGKNLVKVPPLIHVSWADNDGLVSVITGNILAYGYGGYFHVCDDDVPTVEVQDHEFILLLEHLYENVEDITPLDRLAILEDHDDIYSWDNVPALLQHPGFDLESKLKQGVIDE